MHATSSNTGYSSSLYDHGYNGYCGHERIDVRVGVVLIEKLVSKTFFRP